MKLELTFLPCFPNAMDPFILPVSDSSTVLEIKLMINQYYGLRVHRCTLIFNGEILPDDLEIPHSEIVDGSIIYVQCGHMNPHQEIELERILTNYSCVLHSPIFNQTPAHTHAVTGDHPPTTIHPIIHLLVLLHQNPTLIVENSPSRTVRSIRSQVLAVTTNRIDANFNYLYSLHPDRRPASKPSSNQTLIQINATTGNQPPFTLLRANVENGESPPYPRTPCLTPIFPDMPGDESRNEIPCVHVFYQAGAFTFVLRSYIQLAANVEVPPSSSRRSFIAHLYGDDIRDRSGQQSGSASSLGEQDSNRGKGLVTEDIAESSGTSADGNVENRSAAGSSANGNVENRSEAGTLADGKVENRSEAGSLADGNVENGSAADGKVENRSGGRSHRKRARTVHNVVSGREMRYMKGEMIVVVIYWDQRSLVVVRRWEQVWMLRERLVQIQFRLPRPIYTFLHRHRIMDEHLTFEHNLVERGDYIQPFPAFIF